MSTSARPTVFLSYSHQDKKWLGELRTMLAPLVHDSLVDVWWDGDIKPSKKWREEIDKALASARIGVLLVSSNFLASDFIKQNELPYLIEAARDRGVALFWVLLSPCLYEHTPLAEIQAAHNVAHPLDSLGKPRRKAVLKEIGQKIAGAAKASTQPGEREKAPNGGAGIKPGVSTPGSAPPTTPSPEGAEASARGGNPGRTGDLPASSPGVETPGSMPAPLKGALPRLDLGRLPIAGPLLIGRETELALLDAAWEDAKTHVLTFVAFGGMGKSALLSHWLDSMSADDWRGARRVLDWSFYSQGTEERVTSADRFLNHTLAWFGDPDPKVGASRDRGLRLAELVRQEKTLLVLDGVEPLQHPLSHPLAGRLKDPGLAALLKGLAGANPGLCVVTTRERIADLEGFPKTAPQKDLEALSPEAGAELLKKLGVQGKDSELLAASREFGNHALTLTLLGGYLSRACEGNIRRRKEVDLAGAAERKGGHALRVIGTYAAWLGEGPELAALRLLGLFDRPAPPKALAVLGAKPAIPGLTEPLMDLGEEEWQSALSSLREHGLLLPADPNQPGTLDAHPLVRVFFQEELETQRPEAWQAGNLRLYEHLQKEAPDLPDTLEAMEPLFTAVIHGCRAGRQQEALYDVYLRRIQRNDAFFSTHKLGAVGSELSALSGFFDHLWNHLSASLTSEEQAFLLNETGFNLRALGRLAEAVQPMEVSLESRVLIDDWHNAAISASNLSELTLTLGEVGRAVAFGKQSVDLSDRSGDTFQRIVGRSTLANALHQAGRLEESAEAFREAEALQSEGFPQYPRLTSLPGYLFCDLLLSLGEPEDGTVADSFVVEPEAARRFGEACRKVRERAEQAMKVAASNDWLLDISLDYLSLGRAYLGLALTAPRATAPSEETEADFAKAAEHLDHAVEDLRRAGQEDYIVRGLLARAALRRLRGNLPASEADLSEALEIAEPGSMRLHECDAHLEWARLCRQRGDREGLERHVARARRLVEETGYGRRRREVEWLERQVSASTPA